MQQHIRTIKTLKYFKPFLEQLHPQSWVEQTKHLGPDHVQLLTLLNWENKSVLALNKKLTFPIDNFYLCLV